MPSYEPRQPVHSGATYRVKFDYGSIHVALYQGTTKVGIITAMFSTDRGDNRASPHVVALRAEFPDVQFYPQVLFVWKAAVAKQHHGKKLGRGMYEALMQAVYNKHGPFLFAPMKDYGTGFGSTSDDAMRVWKSLSIRYPSSGNVIAVVDRPRITDPLMSTDSNMAEKVASRFMQAADNENHAKSIAIMKFLSKVAIRLGCADHTYIVGGAVRDFVLGKPIKDADVVIDWHALGGKKNSEWFAENVARAIPTQTSLVTNNYGVAILSISGDWFIEPDLNMKGEVIEVANSRSESYGTLDGPGKGYKPDIVESAPITIDVSRRELTYCTLMWRLSELAHGPDKAEIIDLTGMGLDDLKAGIMRCPASPDVVFSDDPSRMIRCIKFLLRYNHQLTPDTKAAILRNADKIKNIPSSHLSTMLVDIVLVDTNWKAALQWMSELHLLDPVRDILLSDKSFRSALQNHVNSSKMDMMFGLMDVGLPLGAKVDFLTPAEQTRVRELTLGMDRDEAWVFLGKLKTPGNAFGDSNFQPNLAAQFGVAKKDVGPFYQRIAQVSRALMLQNPALADMPEKLKQLVSQAL